MPEILAAYKNAADFVQLQASTAQRETLEQQLGEQMSRWVYLHDLNDRICAQEELG